MNDIIKSLYDRKSTRVFEDRPIPEELVQEILNAAVQAPTAGNQQFYTILRVSDPEKLRRLADSCDHQPFIATAKLVLVFLADSLRWYNAYIEAGGAPRPPQEGDLMLAVVDSAIAAQNAVVAAESLGIGSCYIGDIMENLETQRDILGFPEYVFPAAMLVFGYPTQQQKDREKPGRLDLKYIVQQDTYHAHTPQELRAMFAERSGLKGYDEWMKDFCEMKYNSAFAKEMQRSVRKALEEYNKQ